MIESLKVFKIDATLERISQNSNVITEFDTKVDYFFRSHIVQSIKDKKSKVARFKSELAPIVTHCKDTFNSENFDSAATNIANQVCSNIGYRVQKDFLIIVLVYSFEEGLNIFYSGNKILAVMKMDTSEGIQLTNNNFSIQPDMLPDLGNKLQKCSFIFEQFLHEFSNNNENDKFHLKILDRQDEQIASYFKNIFDAYPVSDDSLSSSIASKHIKRVIKKYVREEDKKKVDDKIDALLSRRENTSVEAIIQTFSDLVQEDYLKSDNIDDLDTLSNIIFNKMLEENPSVSSEFVFTFPHVPRIYLKSSESQVKVSIEKGLVTNGIVEIIHETSTGKYKIIVPDTLVSETNLGQ